MVESASNLRVCIAGGPMTGKTTLARKMALSLAGVAVRHTDDLIVGHSWGEMSDLVCGWLSEPGPWVIEGVAVVRGLRKWLRENETGRPCDRFIFMRHQLGDPNGGQKRMSMQCEAIWTDIGGDLTLIDRGVEVHWQNPYLADHVNDRLADDFVVGYGGRAIGE